MRVPNGDDKLVTLHFAEDHVIFAENEENICYMVRKLNDA